MTFILYSRSSEKQRNVICGLPFPSPGDFPDPGIEPGSPALQEVTIWATRTPFTIRKQGWWSLLNRRCSSTIVGSQSFYYTTQELHPSSKRYEVGWETYRSKDKCTEFLVVQWLGHHALTAEGLGLMPGQQAKIPQAVRHGLNNSNNKR